MPEPPGTYLGTSNAKTFKSYKRLLYLRAQEEQNSDKDVKSELNDENDSSGGLNSAEIAGIVIGAVVGLLLAIALMYFGIRRYRNKHSNGLTSVTKVQPLP